MRHCQDLLAGASTALLALSLAACFPATSGTGKGTGKETGGCLDGIVCDEGLQCVVGFCVPADGTEDRGDTSEEDGETDLEDSDAGTATPETCGDGVLDPGEACDGPALDDKTCVQVGYDFGELSCAENCSFDTSECSNQPQPGVGELYSHCLEDEDCPGLDGCAGVPGADENLDGFCTNFCDDDSTCQADVGGSAVPECNKVESPYCQLDCSDGKTCPEGMKCISNENSSVCF